MNIFEDTNPRKLSEMLSLIHSGDMGLPDFQRSFVWEASSTQELIISIANNYPAGSILRVKNPNNMFSVREFEGSPSLNGRNPVYLILDGQQRLTSLYQAFYGKGAHRFFISLQDLLDGKDFEDSIFHLRKDKADKKYNTLGKQAKMFIMPLEIIYGNESGFFGWMDSMIDLKEFNKQEGSNLRTQLRKLHEEWIKPIEQYLFPVVTLSDRTDPAAVCTIFETLNRTGVKLSVFELLTARFWPQGINLRAMLDEAKQEFPLIEEFEIDPYYIIQSLSLLNSKKAPSCKRKDILNDLDSSMIKEFWGEVTKAYSEILKILLEDCGVFSPRWLPYSTILIPMAAVWTNLSRSKGLEVGLNRKMLTQWFWCSVFSQSYENSPNSQASKDFVEVNLWIKGEEEPETIQRFSFDIDQLRETTPRQRAIYRGIICLILQNRPIDFYEGKKKTPELLKDNKIDDHHIYPDAYLCSLNIEKSKRDCILNRTLIDRSTNQRIGKRPPKEYLKDIENNLGLETLNKIIKSHRISKDLDFIRNESYEEFLENRLEILRQDIAKVTCQKIDKANGGF